MTAEGASGILNTPVGLAKFATSSHPASLALAPFVDFYWIVSWDLRGLGSHTQHVLTHPTVHLVFQQNRCGVYGVMGTRFTEVLHGAGRVLGVRFRPGGFRPFLRAPVSTITDRFLGIQEVFGNGSGAAGRAVLDAPHECEMLAEADRFLCGVLPERDPVAEAVAEIVDHIAARPDITRVDQLARDRGVGSRQLQRLFSEYVGVGPKWVIRRYRLQEAAARLAREAEADPAALAYDLGYSDQAHFTRDFAAAVGTPPRRYSQRRRPTRGTLAGCGARRSRS